VGIKLNLLDNVIQHSLNFQEQTLLFNDLLLQTWHNNHENIVHDIQRYFHENIDTITTLLNLLQNPPNRNAYVGFFEVLARKIIFAIGAHPEPNNMNTLEELTKSSNIIISDLAIHQLDKRRRLGRWEAANIKDWEK
jgi:hypothetical protein